MANNTVLEQLRKHEIPGLVSVTTSHAGLPAFKIKTRHSTAEILLRGAHVTHFQKNGEPPVLFTSRVGKFGVHDIVHSGAPIVFPWFGYRHKGDYIHGFGGLVDWELREAVATPEGGAQLRFNLTDVSAPKDESWTPFSADCVVTVNDKLSFELDFTNRAKDKSFNFEHCLHTYFELGDIEATTINGLRGATFLDKMGGFQEKIEDDDAIRIRSTVDRVYFNTTAPVEIHDTKQRRKIRLDKTGAASTVVWNPWGRSFSPVPDLADGEFKRMVCVESGNVGPNKLSLPPGKTSASKLVISTSPL